MINFNKMWKTFKVAQKREIKELNYEDIDSSQYVLIDVRSKREFKEYHIKGAINIPLPEIKRNIEKYVKDKHKKILLYCQSGIRSEKAAIIIEKLGYMQVYNLKGGLENI